MAASSTTGGAAAVSTNEAEMAAAAVAEEAKRFDLLAEVLSLVVFDFDLTVLSIHSWGERIDEAEVESRDWKDDFEDLELFTRVCRNLVERGVPVAIASFGKREVITKYLDLAFGGDRKKIFPDNCISTPSAVDGTDGVQVAGGKNPQMAKIREELGVASQPAASVLLFEDDFANCKLAVAEGIVAFHCPKHFMKATWASASKGFLEHYAPKLRAEMEAAGGAAAPAPESSSS